VITAIVNGKEFKVEPGKRRGTYVIDGHESVVDVIRLQGSTFHLLLDNKSMTLEIVSPDAAGKSFEVRVNSSRYTVQLRDRYDELLHELGMDAAAMNKVNDLKAPMPGMVVAVHVQDGQEVKKGDLMVTLEAMKMENTLKAGGDGVVARVGVTKGQAVEKNEVLVHFA
jgi:acetyl/propionyl-CoA carboxylase alpha subunit